MKLNLGCGSHVPEGWVNADYALGARLARLPLFPTLNRRLRLFDMDWNPGIRLHDLTRPFPWPDGSADVVYSSHTLEHFTKEDGRRFLGECHRVLRHDGIVRIVVPDLAHTVNRYLRGELAADDFVAELDVLYLPSANPLKNRLSPFIQFPHKCMYDSASLQRVLTEVGFAVRDRGPFDSDIADIRVVELEPRTHHAVIVEGRKR